MLGFSAGHFLVASAAAFVTYGLDLDRLRSRSMLSRASGVVHDILWYPHDSFLRALPPGSINRMGVVPGVLIGSSLVWGLAIYGLWRATRRSHS